MRKGFKPFLVESGKFIVFILAVNLIVAGLAWVWDESFIESKAEASFSISCALLYWFLKRY